MHASNDFSPRRSVHDRVDASELIQGRDPSTDEVGSATDEPAGLRPQSSTRGRTLAFVALISVGVAAAAPLALLIVLPLGWTEQAVAGALMIAGALALSRSQRSTAITMAMMTLSLFATLRYLYWRTVQTWQGLTSAGPLLQWDTMFVVVLLAAEFYALTTLVLNYFQTLRPLRRSPAALTDRREEWPTIDVFVPTRTEPMHEMRATVLGALALDYPADKINVYVLDDGRRAECGDWVTHVGATYLSRVDATDGKAGSINDALTRTRGDLIAIFDPQHVPTRSFLTATVGWFVRDPRLALVQTPHRFFAPDPYERNLGERDLPHEGALFHRLVQDGSDLWNAAVFCGSCAVIRRHALDEIGGIAAETESEDTHTALRLQCHGWNTAFLDLPQAGGLATESLSAHIHQRIRRARGMLQILRLDNPLFARGLSCAQRLCYLTSITRFLFAWPRLIFLTIPLAYLLFGVITIYGDAQTIAAYAIPHLFLAHLTNARIQRGVRPAFWNHIYESVLAPYLLVPTVTALFSPRKRHAPDIAGPRVVERAYFDRRVALPLIVLLGLNIAGLVVAYRRVGIEPAYDGMLILNAIWAVYNIVVLSVGASVAREQQQRRHDVRVDARVPLTLIIPGGRTFTGLTSQLSRTGTTAWFDVPVELRGEADVTLRLRWQGDQCEFDSRVVSVRGNREIHLLFPRLHVRQERFLVDAIYASPDAWLTATAVDDELPFARFWQIVRLAVRGLGVVVAGLLMPVRALAGASGRGRRRRKSTQTATASMIVLAMLLPGWGDIEAASRQSVQPVIFSDAPQADDVKAAVIVASWFGMLSDGPTVRFPVAVGDVPRGHAIVLVRRGSAIESMLSLPAEPRTLVTIRENPRDVYGKLLVIVGESPSDLVRAARVLAAHRLSTLSSNVLPIRDDTMPTRARYDAPRWVSSVQPTPFGSFTEQLTLTTSKPVDVYFRLPPDLYLAAQPFVPLHLRFMFTGNGQTATLHVRLNGSDVGSLALRPTSSNEPRDEIVRVPTHQFHQYGNTLSFVLTRDASSSSDDLSIRIAPDSTIDLHRLPHSVAQPQLGLVVDAGYPFTAQPDLSGTAVVLSTRPTMREYETVLNMAGVFGAETGVAATGVTIADARHIDQVRDKDLIVLGGPIAQPLLSVWSNVMPLGLTAAGPVINDAARSTPWAHPMWPFGDSDRERLARLIGAGYTFDAVLEQFASPYRPDRSVVVIVPGDDGGAFAAKTFSARRPGEVYGGVAVGRDGRFESFQLRVGTYRAGDAEWYQRVVVGLLERYWLIAPIVLMCALAIGWVVSAGTDRVIAKRLTSAG